MVNTFASIINSSVPAAMIEALRASRRAKAYTFPSLCVIQTRTSSLQPFWHKHLVQWTGYSSLTHLPLAWKHLPLAQRWYCRMGTPMGTMVEAVAADAAAEVAAATGA